MQCGKPRRQQLPASQTSDIRGWESHRKTTLFVTCRIAEYRNIENAIREFYVTSREVTKYKKIPEHILEHPFYKNIQLLVANGPPTVGYAVSPWEALKDEKIGQLVQLVNVKYWALEALSYAFPGDHSKYVPENIHASLSPMFLRIISNDFRQELIAAHKKGQLSAQQLQFYLGEDFDWEIKFERWKILGRTRLSRNDQGEFTDIPLTHDMIRNETRVQLGLPR